MNTHRNRKKLFIAGTFVLLLMLAFGSMITFAKNGARTSYTLTIVKKLDFSDIPENERPSLSDLAYRFQITGARGNNPPEPIDQQVTIDNFHTTDGHAEGSATIELGSSSAVSVIELTNKLDPDFVGYGVSETSYESHMHVNNGYAEVTLSKEKNWLTISPSEPADGVDAIKRVYRVTGPGFSEYYTIEDGGKQEIKDLAPGNYVIEAVKAPDGFSVDLENPKITVNPSPDNTASATIKINGESGTATVTAGGTPGDGRIHYFTAIKEGDSSFKEEEFSLASGETYERDHLTSGEYTLSAQTFEGNPAYSITASGAPKVIDSGKKTFTTFTRGSTRTFTTKGDPAKGDYVTVSLSGLTSESNINYTAAAYTSPANSDTYYYKKNTTTGEYEKTTYISLTRTTKGESSVSAWPINDTYRLPVGSDKGFRFGFPNSGNNPSPLGITSCTINYTVYRPGTTRINAPKGLSKEVRVYNGSYLEGSYIEISKNEDTIPGLLDNVQYKFTITHTTTGNIYTAILGGKDGPWSQRLSIPAGTYTVEQEMIQKEPSAFTVSVKDQQYTTKKDTSITAVVAGSGSTIKLTKPSDPDDHDPKRKYREYHFKVTGPSFPNEVTVALSVGEPKKLRELLTEAGVQGVPAEGQGYAPGEYTITPLDDNYVGFDLDYSDSCTVAIVGSSATVTITNKYAKVNGSYRVVHEYYADDGMMQQEGKSDIFQLFDDVFGTHTENEVTRLPNFTLPTGETYFYECKAFAYGDYGSYEPEPATVSGNSPEMPLSAVIPDENPDVSENDPVDEQPDIAVPDDRTADGQNPDISVPDTPDSDAESEGEYELETAAPNDPDSDAAISGSSDSGKENAAEAEAAAPNSDELKPDPDAETSDGQDTNAAAPSVTARSGSKTYRAVVAGSRNAFPEKSGDSTVRGWTPGARGSVAKASAERTPYVRNAVTENPDAADADDGHSDEQSMGGAISDTAVSGNDAEPAAEQPVVLAPAAENDNFTDDGSYIEVPAYKDIQATPNGDKIIILKYVRRNIVTTGSYRVVHRYYLRDSAGDHLEGTVTDPDVTDLPLDYSLTYTAEKNVGQKPRFSPQNSGITHTYTYDSAVYGPYTDDAGNNALDAAYQPASGKNCVYATPGGDEVIVLRYVRTVSYNVVHEYYLRTPVDSALSISESSAGEIPPVGRDNRTGDAEENGGDSGTDSPEEDTGEDNNDEDNTKTNYQYDYEGRTRINSITGNLNETYTEARVDRLYSFRPQSAPGAYNYTPFAYAYGELANDSDRGYAENSSMNNAIATPAGDQIIIIKYYRDPGSTPEPDPTPPPQPDPGPEPDDDHHREPEPEPEPELEIIPEPEPEPELPTELPDPNDPDSPEKITIMEDGVPRTYVKVWDPRIDEWVYIPEEEVPLWGFPATGDNSDSILWIILSAASFAGILFLWAVRDKEIFPKKRN